MDSMFSMPVFTSILIKDRQLRNYSNMCLLQNFTMRKRSLTFLEVLYHLILKSLVLFSTIGWCRVRWEHSLWLDYFSPLPLWLIFLVARTNISFSTVSHLLSYIRTTSTAHWRQHETHCRTIQVRTVPALIHIPLCGAMHSFSTTMSVTAFALYNLILKDSTNGPILSELLALILSSFTWSNFTLEVSCLYPHMSFIKSCTTYLYYALPHSTASFCMKLFWTSQ